MALAVTLCSLLLSGCSKDGEDPDVVALRETVALEETPAQIRVWDAAGLFDLAVEACGASVADFQAAWRQIEDAGADPILDVAVDVYCPARASLLSDLDAGRDPSSPITTPPTAPADSDTDIAIFGTTDQFDRADSTTTLGALAPRHRWQAVAGTWGITEHQAHLAAADPLRSIAVVDLGQGDGGVQVRLDEITESAGIVFRYENPYNYWAVIAIPEVSTWNVIKVSDGDTEVVGNTGQSPTVDGTTIAVRMVGDTTGVVVNGRLRKTLVDDFLAAAGGVGITGKGPDAEDARFDDFVAGLPDGLPLP